MIILFSHGNVGLKFIEISTGDVDNQIDWFFVEEGDFTIGSPYNRSYYHYNNHEIYFYIYTEGYVKAYKGLNREKWEEIGVNTLHESVSLLIPLNKISITDEGRLDIPTLRKLLFEKIIKFREINKELRLADRAREEARKDSERLFQERLRASQRSINFESNKPVQNTSQKKTIIQYEQLSKNMKNIIFLSKMARNI